MTGKKWAVVESMFTFSYWSGAPGYASRTVRVWRQEDDVRPHYDNDDLLNVCLAYRDMVVRGITNADLGASRVALAEALAAMPRVNAVEIKETDGSGLLIYPEWP